MEGSATSTVSFSHRLLRMNLGPTASQLASISNNNNNNLSLWATATFQVLILLSSAVFLSEGYSSCPISLPQHLPAAWLPLQSHRGSNCPTCPDRKPSLNITWSSVLLVLLQLNACPVYHSSICALLSSSRAGQDPLSSGLLHGLLAPAVPFPATHSEAQNASRVLPASTPPAPFCFQDKDRSLHCHSQGHDLV